MDPFTGKKAPNFEFNTHDGKHMSLRDYIGKTVVIYFYPKDDTPGCTKEACSFRDHWPAYEKEDVTVFGISTDGDASHQAFREKYNLPFTLVPDPEAKIARAYGVYDEARGHAQRRTFVIDGEGRIRAVFANINVNTHSQDILALIAHKESNSSGSARYERH